MSAGRVALVTGASRGLGFSLARALAGQDTQVWALARTQGALEELDDTIAQDGGIRPTLLPLDITDAAALARMAGAIGQRHGRLDLLMHCAIHAPHLSPVAHLDAKTLDRGFAVNALAVPSLLRAVDPLFGRAEAPVAVFIGDPNTGTALWSPYRAGKEAGLAFARAYAAERDKAGIAVHVHDAPPMPTATRARFFPGENRDRLTPCAEVARDILAAL